MSVTLSSDKNILINNVVESQGFTDYEVKVTSGSMKGDGYLGIINTVDIQDNKNPARKLHLIMKSAMTEEKLREVAPVRKVYEREIYLYETVFPEFAKFSDEVHITNKFTETAKCYGSLLKDQEECIILENLKENDFKLWNRKVPMNEEHVELVFKTYAKFHATGLALKFLKPEKFDQMHENVRDLFQKENETEEEKEKSFQMAKQVFENGFKAVVDNPTATQALTNFTQNCQQFFTEDVRKFDKYSTILHGDCWCNNMMFKYKDPKDSSTPSEVCLLDWQLSRVGSPISDLSYFFYACTSKQELYKLKKFLKCYHETVSRILTDAGLDPDKVLTFEELENQWKIHSKYGLFMTLFVMNVVLSETEEAPDLSELARSGTNILDFVTNSEFVNKDMVNRRISDVIVFMNEFNYL